MGSPVGTTTGGDFRFTCSSAQDPCKVSIAAAVLSDTTGSARVYARVLIYKEVAGRAQTFCEYADGSDNDGGSAEVSKVPVNTSVTSINRLDMGIGSTLDCNAGQTSSNGIVQNIEVPGGSTGNASYDVSTTFAFK